MVSSSSIYAVSRSNSHALTYCGGYFGNLRVEIHRILHGSQNISQLLFPEFLHGDQYPPFGKANKEECNIATYVYVRFPPFITVLTGRLKIESF